MKRLILFFLCFPSWLYGQWCIDFEDGSLSGWNQDRDSSWQIRSDGALSGDYSLHHAMDDSMANHDQIALPLDSLELDAQLTTWEFRIRHEYLPSSANHWGVYLAADGGAAEMLPAGALNAFMLGVNLYGSDDTLKLWKKEQKHIEILATTSLDWQKEIGTGQAYLKVLRQGNGIWQVLRYKDGIWELIGEGKDTAVISPDYFGIYYRYSSKQDMKLWFDDLCISGLFIPDTLPPCIVSCAIIDQHTLCLTFSEPLNESECLIKGNFLLKPTGAIPDSLSLISPSTCKLSFPGPFPEEIPLTLIVFNLEDTKGNSVDSLKVDFLYYKPRPNDLVFNEIMSDPSPPVGLPEYEYIELYNRSPHPLNLEGWILSTGHRLYPFPYLEIAGGKYLLLGKEGIADQFVADGRFLGLFNSGTSLPNEGTILSLLDRDSLLIDWMEYDPGMHDTEYHASGGWSLERLDPDRECMSLDNWATSKSRMGGTPGQVNSMKQYNPDQWPPSVGNLYLRDSCTLIIEFSEGMDPGPLLDPMNYLVNPGGEYPAYVECTIPDHRTAILHFDRGFEQGRELQLELSGNVVDCAGLSVLTGRIQRFALAVPPADHQVFISEILFDPKPYCPHFIEIHNRGSMTLDLADLRIGRQNHKNNQVESVSPVSSGHKLFFPGVYLALTEDPEKLMGCCYVHDPETLIRCKGLPVMDDSEGTMLIMDKYLRILDKVSYRRQMHYPLLTSTEGVSLERISFEIPSDLASNWHSAAATEGYATPGRLNSQHLYWEASEGIEIDPEIFSPDQDGHHDLLMIRYDFSHSGGMATVMVVDPRGRVIKKIADNQLLGTEGFFTWDGTDEHGQLARAGLYLVYVRIFGVKGEVTHYKETCVLSTGTRY